MEIQKTGLNELLRNRVDGVSCGKFFCEPFIPAASCEVFWFKNKTKTAGWSARFVDIYLLDKEPS